MAKRSKLCGNTTRGGHANVFAQFPVFPISTCVHITVYINTEKRLVIKFFYDIAQRNMKKEIFCVDIELCQHGS